MSQPSEPGLDRDLAPTAFIESDAPSVIAFAEAAVGDADDDLERARRLFRAVRDEIRYDPYSANILPETYRATVVVQRGRAFCAPKAVLMAAAARALGISARVGFADVRNHLATEKLLALMRTDVFYFHGYTALLLDGRWVKATPTFDRELCARFGVAPLEFDGREDALLHPFDGEGRQHMEYIRDHGSFDDLPLDRLIAVWREGYPHFFEGGGLAEDPGAG